MTWSILDFGKHEGKTLPQVLFNDPDWFFWAIDKNMSDTRGYLKNELELLNYRATHIKIPEKYGKDNLVEYTIHPSAGKFGRIDIIESDRPEHMGSSGTIRLKYIDMSVVRHLSKYDKTGGKLLIKNLKFHLFGDSNKRLTKKTVEDFFNNDSNFK